MTEKNQLNNEDLNQVSGGGLREMKNGYANEYTRKLDKYETANYIGQDLLFKYKDIKPMNGQMVTFEAMVFGTLVDSYEKSNEDCGTTRTFIVKVLEYGGSYTFMDYRNTELSSDDWTAFAK